MPSGLSSSAGATLAGRGSDLILPLAMVASVLVIVAPLPPALLDVLLAGNITVAVLILLTTIYVRTPLDFSIFPTLLLATTLARLVLNVATTRLILTDAGKEQLGAAGNVIAAFADFVAGDRMVVGAVIFGIIVVIQFVVITKGATRISEVAARFALDGLPGKQMAIDADLAAGFIDKSEAQRRRSELTQQADFYGAMDGASKFVRGDAIAGIMITLINIAGGFAIGVTEYGMSLADAASTFTRLTIGDGLVSQLPAFLISLAAGLLVTRSTQRSNMPRQFSQQLFAQPQSLAVTGGFLSMLLFTGLPRLPLLVLGAGCLGLALMLPRKAEESDLADQSKGETVKQPTPTSIGNFLAVDPLEIELGVGLISLADTRRGGDLLDRIHQARNRVAAEIGIIMPKVRLRDNLRLPPNHYRIKIADVPVATDEVQPRLLLAIDSSRTTSFIDGLPANDPVTGRGATWIDPDLQAHAELHGYAVAEPGDVLTAHLTETCRRHADELLTRDATKHLLDELRATSPAAVDELIPHAMTLAEVQCVLQNLLREQVSIRQLGMIVEALGDYAPRSKDPIALTEFVRQRLARQICTRYRDAENRLHVVMLDPVVEDQIRAGVEQDVGKLRGRVAPQAIESLCVRIRDEIERLMASNYPPIVLVPAPIRPALKHLTKHQLPQLAVLSFDEITRDTKIVKHGLLKES